MADHSPQRKSQDEAQRMMYPFSTCDYDQIMQSQLFRNVSFFKAAYNIDEDDSGTMSDSEEEENVIKLSSEVMRER